MSPKGWSHFMMLPKFHFPMRSFICCPTSNIYFCMYSLTYHKYFLQLSRSCFMNFDQYQWVCLGWLHSSARGLRLTEAHCITFPGTEKSLEAKFRLPSKRFDQNSFKRWVKIKPTSELCHNGSHTVVYFRGRMFFIHKNCQSTTSERTWWLVYSPRRQSIRQRRSRMDHWLLKLISRIYFNHLAVPVS